jgi:hypothetical protein
MGNAGLEKAKSTFSHYGDLAIVNAATAGLNNDQGPRNRPKTLLPYIGWVQMAKSFSPYMGLSQFDSSGSARITMVTH